MRVSVHLSHGASVTDYQWKDGKPHYHSGKSISINTLFLWIILIQMILRVYDYFHESPTSFCVDKSFMSVSAIFTNPWKHTKTSLQQCRKKSIWTIACTSESLGQNAHRGEHLHFNETLMCCSACLEMAPVTHNNGSVTHNNVCWNLDFGSMSGTRWSFGGATAQWNLILCFYVLNVWCWNFFLLYVKEIYNVITRGGNPSLPPAANVSVF